MTSMSGFRPSIVDENPKKECLEMKRKYKDTTTSKKGTKKNVQDTN